MRKIAKCLICKLEKERNVYVLSTWRDGYQVLPACGVFKKKNGNIITHTRDNDTLLTFIMRFSVAPHRGEQQKKQLYHTRFCHAFA